MSACFVEKPKYTGAVWVYLAVVKRFPMGWLVADKLQVSWGKVYTSVSQCDLSSPTFGAMVQLPIA